MASLDGQGGGTQKEYGQEKARLLQKEIARAARRTLEDDCANGRRRTPGGRRPNCGSCGQSCQLVHERVFVRHDKHGPGAAESDRRGAPPYRRRRIRRLRQLRRRDATKAAGSSAMGEALHQLPGKGRKGTTVNALTKGSYS